MKKIAALLIAAVAVSATVTTAFANCAHKGDMHKGMMTPPAAVEEETTNASDELSFTVSANNNTKNSHHNTHGEKIGHESHGSEHNRKN